MSEKSSPSLPLEERAGERRPFLGSLVLERRLFSPARFFHFCIFQTRPNFFSTGNSEPFCSWFSSASLCVLCVSALNPHGQTYRIYRLLTRAAAGPFRRGTHSRLERVPSPHARGQARSTGRPMHGLRHSLLSHGHPAQRHGFGLSDS